ncbi:zinc knuckle [Trichuris suis]|nr:zinc knuckle [Trichuris suis]
MSLFSDGLYEMVRNNGLNRQCTFQQLSAFLETRFCRPESAVERYLAFQRRKQCATETACEFGEAIRSLGRQAGIVADEPPETFDQAVEHARRVEEAEALLQTMVIGRNSSDRTIQLNRDIGNVPTAPTRQTAKSSKRQNCWACNRPGHVRRQCPTIQADVSSGHKENQSSRTSPAINPLN